MRSVAKIVRFTYERMGGRNQFSGTKQILHVLDMGRIQRISHAFVYERKGRPSDPLGNMILSKHLKHMDEHLRGLSKSRSGMQ